MQVNGQQRLPFSDKDCSIEGRNQAQITLPDDILALIVRLEYVRRQATRMERAEHAR